MKEKRKEYVLILVFSKDAKKVLLIKRKKEPYKNCWNGIGGKVEINETVEETAIRECLEETEIKLDRPKLLMTCIYPISNTFNSETILHILYEFVEERIIIENEEGVYEWKEIKFALDFTNKQLAGFGNISQYIKEIYDNENIKKFY